jgi:hypothetical protein
VLAEIVREGARRMLAAALEAEVDGCIEVYVDERDGAAGDWSSATGGPSGGRSRRAPARWRSKRPA